MRRLLIAITLTLTAPLCWAVHGQGRGQAPPPPPPPSGRAGAPYDITGYWVALVTDDWRYRMLTPPKGNVDYLPITAEGRRATNDWDPAKDAATGQECKAFGAGGIMRLPIRIHVTWDDESTLRMDIDAGRQTRRFFFENTPQATTARPSAAQASWQGYSVARWELPGAGGRGGARGPSRFGQLKVTTTNLRPGYARRNGVPYGANATLTEYFLRLGDRSGQEYLAVTTMLDDPTYFQPPYIKTYEFKKQQDATGWNPTACTTK